MKRSLWSFVLAGSLVGGSAALAVWFGYKPQFEAVLCAPHRIQPAGNPFHDRRTRRPRPPYTKSTRTRNSSTSRAASCSSRRCETSRSWQASRFFAASRMKSAGWAENLKVEYPLNSEIMNVSLRGANPQEVATLVNAVVDAYMREVVSKEQGQRAERLSQLDRLYADTENDWRSKRSQMRNLAERLGTGERETLTLQQQIALQQSAACRTELTTIHLKWMHSQSGTPDIEKQPACSGPGEIDGCRTGCPIPDCLRGRSRRTTSEMTQAASCFHGRPQPRCWYGLS